MYIVYVLRSLKDQKFYIGQTNDIEKRLQRHNNGFVVSTRSRRPFILVYNESFISRAEAMRREKYLKSLKGGSTFYRIIGSIR